MVMTRLISGFGEERFITGLGGMYLALAVGHAVPTTAGHPVSAQLADAVLLVVPSLGLLYGGYRLPRTDIHPDTYPRVAVWCLRGIAVMVGVVLVLELNPAGSIDREFYTPAIATALGSVGGLGVGINEARAVTRAYDAEARTQQLQRERDLRARIVATSPIGISVIDTDGTISFVNEHIADIIGCPQNELLGREYDSTLFEASDADGNPIEDGVFHHVLSTGEPVYNVERQITRADGERIWLSVNAAPLCEGSGDVSGVVFAVEDITRDRDRQQQLEQQNNRLQSFAGMLAHELRNPLQIAQIYHPQAVAGDEQAADHLETALNRIEEMIDVLLVTVRTTEADIECQPMALADIATDAWEDLSAEVETGAADLSVQSEQTIRADPVYVEHLLRNLFRNCIEHGGEDVSIHIGDLTHGFYVADDGPGIPEDARDDVVTAGFTTKADGIGVGLTFVAQLVELYAWEYTLTESAAGGMRIEFTDVDLVGASGACTPDTE